MVSTGKSWDMRVCIRADSSASIGTGHVMRCLTLANALRDVGATISFICGELHGNLNEYVAQKGYRVQSLSCKKSMDWEEDVKLTQAILEDNAVLIDWLIVDHYGIDSKWESVLRLYAKKIMVIDDLANRKHDCDVLLDQNYYPDSAQRYDNLVPAYCQRKLGPQHALLRPEFPEARKNLRQRDGRVGRMLIYFGGSDPTNEAEKALLALRMLDRPDIHVDVVVGKGTLHRSRIEKLCGEIPNATFHCQISNIAERMAEADLAVGAGGASTWERCFLGLPTLTVIVADNQIETTTALAQIGAIWSLGHASEVTVASVVNALRKALAEPAALRERSLAAQRVMGLAEAGGACDHSAAADLADLMMQGIAH